MATSNPPPAMVYYLPGEPVAVIDGVAEPTPDAGPPAPSDPAKPAAARVNPGFGGWIGGRDVRKLFGDRYYSGTVTEFDKEAGWYRVAYEDGDSEDLEWPELEEVLVPVDITVPLKSLALRVLRKTQRSAQTPGAEEPQTTKKRGRPKGSKNKEKKVVGKAEEAEVKVGSRTRGRPKGSKNKKNKVGEEEGKAPPGTQPA